MIAIVGTSGQLCQLIVEQLLARGSRANQILIILNDGDELASPPVDQVVIRRLKGATCHSLESAFATVKTLILVPTGKDPESAIQRHNQVLAAAKTAKIQRVIMLSLSCAQPASRVLVAPFLLYSECALRSSGLNWLILRRSLFIDSVAAWAQAHISAGYFPLPLHGGRCSYVSKRDVAAAVAASCLSDYRNEVLDLTGPTAISIKELSTAFSRSCGQLIEAQEISDDQFLELTRSEGASSEKAAHLLSFFHGIDGGEFARATDHLEKLSGSPAESALTAFRRLKSNF
jgi:uncharacterized protein YbjT (DUF2867 family)